MQMFYLRCRLGQLVYRMACNYTPDFQITDMCENWNGAGFGTTLTKHQWAFRQSGCKSQAACQWI